MFQRNKIQEMPKGEKSLRFCSRDRKKADMTENKTEKGERGGKKRAETEIWSLSEYASK